MNNDSGNQLMVTSSPHIRSADNTAKIMWTVSACLLPSGLVSVYYFGISALWIMLCAVVSAMCTEYACARLMRKTPKLADGSAVLTGLLLAYNLPAGAPLWMVVIGSFVAIFLGKVVFGGLGFNVFNPALVGRVFLMASFPVLMTTWPAPAGVDAITAPTPLAVLKDTFAQTGIISADEIVKYSNLDLFLGYRGGCIGEACILALLIGAAVLLIRGYISWHIPLSFIGTVLLFTWAFGGQGLFQGDALRHLLSGGLVLGAFYMATDYVTGPVTRKGQIIFGFGCGLITAVIRLWGGYPEGVSYSILLMNSATPLIDRFIRPRRFGARQ